MAKRFTGFGLVAVLTAVGGFAMLGACGSDSDSGDCTTLPACCSQLKESSDIATCKELLTIGDPGTCGDAQADFVSEMKCVVSSGGSSTSATGCAGLSACCSKLSSAEQAGCNAVVSTNDDSVCTEELTGLAAECPATTTSTGTGCAGLSTCCATLTGVDQTSCEEIAASGSDSVCTTELTAFSCSTGTSTGACVTLEACCATSSDPSACEEAAGGGVETTCTDLETVYCGTVSSDDAGTGTGDCATLSACCATSSDEAECESTVSSADEELCAAEESTFCTGDTTDAGTGSGGCSALSDCCSSLPSADQAACQEEVSEGTDATCSETLSAYMTDGLCS